MDPKDGHLLLSLLQEDWGNNAEKDGIIILILRS